MVENRQDETNLKHGVAVAAEADSASKAYTKATSASIMSSRLLSLERGLKLVVLVKSFSESIRVRTTKQCPLSQVKAVPIDRMALMI